MKPIICAMASLPCLLKRELLLGICIHELRSLEDYDQCHQVEDLASHRIVVPGGRGAVVLPVGVRRMIQICVLGTVLPAM